MKLAGWLADEVAAVELADERLREALLARCRAERIEPPARVNRILGMARAAVAERFTATTASRLPPPTVLRLEDWPASRERERTRRRGCGWRS